jgi:hypothetical protein
VIFTDSGTAAVTISAETLTGAGFSVSGATFPVTLNPKQAVTLTVGFDPTAAGATAGQLTITSNSTTNPTAVVSLSGTGVPVLDGLTCSTDAMTGSGTDVCTVTLNAAAPSGGVTVSLGSSNGAITVPATVTVTARAATATFMTTVSSVSTAALVSLTATAGSVTESFAVQLNPAVATLTIDATSVPFGDVEVNTTTMQSVTVTSTGTSPVILIGAALIGAGFNLSAPALPVTLNPNQAVTLSLGFAPTAAGAATGQLIITSNSSTNPSAAVSLSGTGVPVVAVTPATVSVTTGATQQFTVSVTGISETSVTWTVSGNGCSGTACGTISSSGLYTAPASVPSAATVTVTATSVEYPTQSASADLTIVPRTYYLAPAAGGGNDSNSGLSPSAPWLSPSHAVNCGDVIIAAPGTYTPGSNNGFQFDWGTVTGTGHCVAILTCATFDACQFISTNGWGISVQTSHWMIEGWQSTESGGIGSCFGAFPNGYNANTQDVVFANDIANGCDNASFTFVSEGSFSVDYFALIADIAYNGSRSSGVCGSGISLYQPVNTDTLPGTHIYVSQTFSWGNVEPATCAGEASTDGEGIILDTWSANSYTGQGVVENNLSFFNGSLGFEVWSNSGSQIYVLNNTSASNDTSASRSESMCGEIGGGSGTPMTEFYQNIARTNAAMACGGNVDHAYILQNATSFTQVYSNFGYSAAGNNTSCQWCSGFSFGSNNVMGTDPVFANLPTTVPPAPSCGSASSVINCMAPVIADFVPTSSAVPAGWGYHPPSTTRIYDPLFPQWLCQYSTELSGLVTMGCEKGSTSSGG